MTDPFVVTGVRLTYHSADLSTLEAASHDDWRVRLETLLGTEGVAEAAVLQTCNRIEEYVVTESAERGREAHASFPDAPDEHVVEMDHGESLRHLLRVAAGLESQVLGEDQILGQVREAYAVADERGGMGSVLEPAFLKAIHVGERARTETTINEGTVSLGGAAIELAGRKRGLDDRTVTVVGAGEMGTTVTKSMPENVAELRVLNRSPERAKALASSHDGAVRTDDLSALAEHLSAADVVFATTGSRDPVIDAGARDALPGTLVVDLAQPRDVAPAVEEFETVTVLDLEDLRTVTDATHEDRKDAARSVEAIVEEEFDLLVDQYKRQRADAVISGMYRGAERIKDAEVERALAQLDDLGAEDREVVESLADSVVSQILAVPTQQLRDAAGEDDWETITTAIDLFDPTGGADTEALFEAESVPPSADDVPDPTTADGDES